MQNLDVPHFSTNIIEISGGSNNSLVKTYSPRGGLGEYKCPREFLLPRGVTIPYPAENPGYDFGKMSGYDRKFPGNGRKYTGYDRKFAKFSDYDRNSSGRDRNGPSVSDYDRNSSGYDRNSSGYDRNSSGYDRNSSGYDRKWTLGFRLRSELVRLRSEMDPRFHYDRNAVRLRELFTTTRECKLRLR